MSAPRRIQRAGCVTLLALLGPFAACDTARDAEVGEAAVRDESATAAADVHLGAEVYAEVCSDCHTLQPPPNLAPPITHVARHVRDEVEDRDAFLAHVVAYLPAPSEAASLLPARAVERFELMPPQNLPEERLRAVAAWLWVMADSAGHGMEEGEMERGGMGEGGMHPGGMGRGGMGGMGRGMGGPPPDTTR